MDQLSRDAAAARAAGMTYGKYKGLQYERERVAAEAARKAAEEARARKAEAKRAAEEVAKQAADPEAKPVKTHIEACLWCGKEFEATGSKKLCSPECKRNWRLEYGRQYSANRRAALKEA